MISVAICIIFLLIFLAVPLPAQIILACINFLVPDPIPYIDEIIMVLSVMKKTVSARSSRNCAWHCYWNFGTFYFGALYDFFVAKI